MVIGISGRDRIVTDAPNATFEGRSEYDPTIPPLSLTLPIHQSNRKNHYSATQDIGEPEYHCGVSNIVDAEV
ncbi:MAG: hypothetical protein M0Q91_17380 [Methanoregula sp.]|nr:hypothetical protein [Methanoregula sp.]